MTMTNNSGKFASVSVDIEADTQDNNGFVGDPNIPEVPAIDIYETATPIDMIRRLFGVFWWLWLVLLIWWVAKND